MGGSSSSPKPLAKLFGSEEEGRRGPTLGAIVLPGPEGSLRLLSASPMRFEVYDAHTAKACPLEDEGVAKVVQERTPFTACSMSDSAHDEPLVAVGCQDGAILVFSVKQGTLSGPLHELKGASAEAEDGAGSGAEEPGSGVMGRVAMGITVLKISGNDSLYAGASGRCSYWDLRTGQLRREFALPSSGGDQPSVPSTLAVVSDAGAEGEEGVGSVACLWVGMDNGSIAVFAVDSGILVRSFSCAGPEALVSLVHIPEDKVVFALSAHRRVSIWDARSYACIQKYPAELMTCGADLTAMISCSVQDPDLNLLMLAGVDGSLCVRRVARRPDGKLNCVLLSFIEALSAENAPITSLSYHADTDSVVVGDAGCRVAVLSRLKEQLGASVQTQSEQALGDSMRNSGSASEPLPPLSASEADPVASTPAVSPTPSPSAAQGQARAATAPVEASPGGLPEGAPTFTGL